MPAITDAAAPPPPSTPPAPLRRAGKAAPLEVGTGEAAPPPLVAAPQGRPSPRATPATGPAVAHVTAPPGRLPAAHEVAAAPVATQPERVPTPRSAGRTASVTGALLAKGQAAAAVGTNYGHLGVLIDGDAIATSRWGPIMAKARALGAVESAQVFGSRKLGGNSSTMKVVETEGLEFVEVERKQFNLANPNDLAIGIYAARLVFQPNNTVTSLGLAVSDIDFVYLAECLHSWGIPAVVLLSERDSMELEVAFRQAHAEVARYNL